MRYTFGILIVVSLLFNSCLDKGEGTSQLQKEAEAIDDYLRASGLVETSLVLAFQSGLRVAILNVNNQTPPPTTGQTINANVAGKLFPDQQLFFDDVIEDEIEDILPSGLRAGLGSLMGGSTALLFVPSSYGYGSTGTTNVPPNTTLIYEVTLNDVIKTASQQTQFTADTTAILEYLEDNSINNAIMHGSGIWYTIDEQGVGSIPTPYDYVTFNYTVKNMANDVVIETGTIEQTSVFSMIDGLKIGLPLLEVGTTATFYIPSHYGYGPSGSGSIGANVNLIFEVELDEVIPFNQ